MSKRSDFYEELGITPPDDSKRVCGVESTSSDGRQVFCTEEPEHRGKHRCELKDGSGKLVVLWDTACVSCDERKL
ncbi:hypothetical protein CMI37_23080 [Candidatus Pacearchaeota archaeon]|nr:hypothetical protein [Candidatus Pacearchaeota archaeon]